MAEYASMEAPEEVKKSRYNSAISQLYRLDALWQDSHRHARDILYAKWNEDLDRIWLELSSDCTKEQKKYIKKINRKISTLFLYAGFQKLHMKNPTLYAKLIINQKVALTKKEAFLRILQNEQGKGTAYEDTIEDYMD
jgi:hypothetical protein